VENDWAVISRHLQKTRIFALTFYLVLFFFKFFNKKKKKQRVKQAAHQYRYDTRKGGDGSKRPSKARYLQKRHRGKIGKGEDEKKKKKRTLLNAEAERGMKRLPERQIL